MNSVWNILVAVILAGLVGIAGCQKETDLGGPGAAKEPGGESDTSRTFALQMPSGQIDVARGAMETFTVTVDRGSEFNQAVTISLMAPAEGISMEPAEMTIPAGKNDAQLTLKIADDAPLGKTNITVIGKPESGESVNGGITVNVVESSR